MPLLPAWHLSLVLCTTTVYFGSAYYQKSFTAASGSADSCVPRDDCHLDIWTLQYRSLSLSRGFCLLSMSDIFPKLCKKLGNSPSKGSLVSARRLSMRRGRYSAASLRLNQTSHAFKPHLHLARANSKVEDYLLLSLTSLYGSQRNSVTDLKPDETAALLLFLFCSRSGFSASAVQLSRKQRSSVCTAVQFIFIKSCISSTPGLERFFSKYYFDWGHTGGHAHFRVVRGAS